ncbi:hypothetical protein HPB49_005003 [Dermacentor silvarum]|uniref:Uncharacterized protein n=1 Tax=Dermacentor silvarum TaxID=543639 RepID=A0ACB8DMS6_DERSI|nr:hypothetical protein HPB49_005003 [Dermacentor silvarum]
MSFTAFDSDLDTQVLISHVVKGNLNRLPAGSKQVVTLALAGRWMVTPYGDIDHNLTAYLAAHVINADGLKPQSVHRVYGTTLRLLDLLSPPPPSAALSTPEYVPLLRDLFRYLKPCQARPLPARTPYVSTALANATHVFVRYGPIRPALHPPYLGRFSILERRESTYIVDIHRKPDTIALDRLKPAYCEATPTVASLNSAPDDSFPVGAHATAVCRVSWPADIVRRPCFSLEGELCSASDINAIALGKNTKSGEATSSARA